MRSSWIFRMRSEASIVRPSRGAISHDDADDIAAKPQVLRAHQKLLTARYEFSDRPSAVKMSGARKAVQEGVRVKRPAGMTWEHLGKNDAGGDSRTGSLSDFPPAPKLTPLGRSFEPDRRPCRRAGGIPVRAVCGCRTAHVFPPDLRRLLHPPLANKPSTRAHFVGVSGHSLEESPLFRRAKRRTRNSS